MTLRTEVRWFVPGDVAGAGRPPGRPVVRTDLYQCSTLTPSRSVKLRGRATLEHKTRTGRVELVEIHGVRGFAETWLKIDDGNRARGDGPWVKVRKELWRERGIEVGRLDVGGQRWWTVCVDAASGARRSPDLLERWRDVLIAHGQPHSYASWILELQRARSARRRR